LVELNEISTGSMVWPLQILEASLRKRCVTQQNLWKAADSMKKVASTFKSEGDVSHLLFETVFFVFLPYTSSVSLPTSTQMMARMPTLAGNMKSLHSQQLNSSQKIIKNLKTMKAVVQKLTSSLISMRSVVHNVPLAEG
jgi:hypothetical protein